MSVRALTAVLVVVLFLAGCSITADSLPKKVANALENAETYYAEMEATVYSTEGEQVYNVKQWVQEPDRWRVEVVSATSSQVFICDGKQIYVYQPGLDDHYRVDADFAQEVAPPFFLAGYLNRLLAASAFDFEGEREVDGEKYYVVSFGGERSEEQVRLWLDRRTRFPMVIETLRHDELLSRINTVSLDLKADISPELFEFSAQADSEIDAHCLVEPISIDEAQQSWPYSIYTPTYLPKSTFLFLISNTEENGIPQLLFVYKGDYHFTLIQSPSPAAQPHLSEATREVMIGSARGYYHANSSDELATLWWTKDDTNFVLCGDLPLEEMVRVAQSVKID